MNDEKLDHSPDGLVSTTPLKIAAKEGAGVPVVEVDENPRFTTAYPLLNDLLQETWWMAKGPNNMDTGMAWYESLKSFLESIATPPAVMPAAPSDAVLDLGDAQIDALLSSNGWIFDFHDDVRKKQIRSMFRKTLNQAAAIGARTRLIEGTFDEGEEFNAWSKRAGRAGSYDAWAGWEARAVLAKPAAGEQSGAAALRKGYVAVPMRLTRAMQDVLEQESWEWADLLMMAEATTEEEDEAIRRFESLGLLEKAEREAAERQEWPTMHPATANLVQRFSQALAEKLAAAEKKYGYSDGWLQSHWMDECRTKLLEHVAKGDPRGVAAYCAFLWHHGESTALAAPGAAIAAREQGSEWPSDELVDACPWAIGVEARNSFRMGWKAKHDSLASRYKAPATPQTALSEQQLYDIIRGTDYVTRGQAWELAELILAALSK